MEAKEKAKELIFKFYDIEKNDGYFDYPLFLFCKECALICVDQVIKAKQNDSSYCDEDGEWHDFDSYWQEVKEEINKL